jgi:predicted RNA binding protein with dsRBD fold (UPF0201 family)
VNEIYVIVNVEVNPTEDSERVRKAVENIILNAEFEVKPQKRGNLLIVKAKGIDSLKKIYDLFRRERVLDAARRVMFKRIGEKSVTFYLNKQVAYIGHISFSEPKAESPLGPIKVQICCNNPTKLIEWLTSKTSM